jgi:hypothetical protein
MKLLQSGRLQQPLSVVAVHGKSMSASQPTFITSSVAIMGSKPGHFVCKDSCFFEPWFFIPNSAAVGKLCSSTSSSFFLFFGGMMPCVLACVCDVMWVRACLVFFYSRSGDNFLRSASGGLRNFFLKFVEICWRFLRQRP